MPNPPEYDLALSFAGEDRDLVERCAQLLRDVGYRVFYDRWEQHDLWGKDLTAHLDSVYRGKARYCLGAHPGPETGRAEGGAASPGTAAGAPPD